MDQHYSRGRAHVFVHLWFNSAAFVKSTHSYVLTKQKYRVSQPVSQKISFCCLIRERNWIFPKQFFLKLQQKRISSSKASKREWNFYNRYKAQSRALEDCFAQWIPGFSLRTSHARKTPLERGTKRRLPKKDDHHFH